jgi:ribosomal protein S18 acetylase RimI-like enzyme
MSGDRARATCRELQSSDEGALAALFGRCAGRHEMSFFDPFPLTPETARRLSNGPTLDRYYVACVDDTIVALSMLRGWDEGYDVPSFGIMVDPEWHGRGVGSELTDFTISAARGLCCAAVRLTVYAENVQAATMYRRRGFLEVSRETVERGWGSDERIVMVKQLRG